MNLPSSFKIRLNSQSRKKINKLRNKLNGIYTRHKFDRVFNDFLTIKEIKNLNPKYYQLPFKEPIFNKNYQRKLFLLFTKSNDMMVIKENYPNWYLFSLPVIIDGVQPNNPFRVTNSYPPKIKINLTFLNKHECVIDNLIYPPKILSELYANSLLNGIRRDLLFNNNIYSGNTLINSNKGLSMFTSYYIFTGVSGSFINKGQSQLIDNWGQLTEPTISCLQSFLNDYLFKTIKRIRVPVDGAFTGNLTAPSLFLFFQLLASNKKTLNYINSINGFIQNSQVSKIVIQSFIISQFRNSRTLFNYYKNIINLRGSYKHLTQSKMVLKLEKLISKVLVERLWWNLFFVIIGYYYTTNQKFKFYQIQWKDIQRGLDNIPIIDLGYNDEQYLKNLQDIIPYSYTFYKSKDKFYSKNRISIPLDITALQVPINYFNNTLVYPYSPNYINAYEYHSWYYYTNIVYNKIRLYLLDFYKLIGNKLMLTADKNLYQYLANTPAYINFNNPEQQLNEIIQVSFIIFMTNDFNKLSTSKYKSSTCFYIWQNYLVDGYTFNFTRLFYWILVSNIDQLSLKIENRINMVSKSYGWCKKSITGKDLINDNSLPLLTGNSLKNNLNTFTIYSPYNWGVNTPIFRYSAIFFTNIMLNKNIRNVVENFNRKLTNNLVTKIIDFKGATPRYNPINGYPNTVNVKIRGSPAC